MGRLIDADELLKAVDKEREYLLARGQKGAEHIIVHNFRDLIDNAPTVENTINVYPSGNVIAQERPHGKWIDRDGNTSHPFWERYECSECHKFSDNTPFCPNCGADMREDSDE